MLGFSKVDAKLHLGYEYKRYKIRLFGMMDMVKKAPPDY
jgi:hypothetical protein